MSRGRVMSNWPRDSNTNAAKSNSRVVALPAELRGNEAGLRTTAANWLDLAHVRSVIIDGSHRQAIVRLDATQSAYPDLGSIPSLAANDPSMTSIGAVSARTPLVSWIDPRDQSLCFIKLPARAQGLRRGLLLCSAGVALFAGLLGIVLPGLPTTPFVLVASYCLLRSSPALHERLLRSRLFGNVLRDWHLHRGLRPHIRYKAIAVILLVLGASLYFTSIPLAAKLMILAVAACGIAFVWRLPDISERGV